MVRERRPCVYILASGKHGTLYIGVTSDLPARAHQHREGLIKGFTSRYGISRLIYYELYETMESAIARERRLKKWNRDWKINLIEAANPGWVDLAEGLGLVVSHRAMEVMGPRLRGDDEGGSG